MSFETFNFHPSITAGVRALGYVTPTTIQLKSIPPITQGRDLIGLTQTGTGKAAAFVLPILQRLLQGPRGCGRVLIISPYPSILSSLLRVSALSALPHFTLKTMNATIPTTTKAPNMYTPIVCLSL